MAEMTEPEALSLPPSVDPLDQPPDRQPDPAPASRAERRSTLALVVAILSLLALAALAFWADRRVARMAQHTGWGHEHYRQAFARLPTRFWANRCGEAPPALLSTPKTLLPHPDQTLVLSGSTSLRPAPCLEADRVTLNDCVIHPGLSEPVAFVGGFHVSPLLRQASQIGSARALIESWSSAIGQSGALAVVAWAWQRGILEASE